MYQLGACDSLGLARLLSEKRSVPAWVPCFSGGKPSRVVTARVPGLGLHVTSRGRDAVRAVGLPRSPRA